MVETISPEKRKAIEMSEKERELISFVDEFGLSKGLKNEISGRVSQVARDKFSFGAIRIFLNWLGELSSSKKISNEERMKLKNLQIDLKDNLTEILHNKDS